MEVMFLCNEQADDKVFDSIFNMCTTLTLSYCVNGVTAILSRCLLLSVNLSTKFSI